MIMALIAIGIIWKATDDWRNPTAHGMADLEQNKKTARKRKLTLTAFNVAILAVATAMGITGVSSTDLANNADQLTQTIPTKIRTYTTPPSVGGYTLMNGGEGSQITARLKLPSIVHAAYYVTSALPTQASVMVETESQVSIHGGRGYRSVIVTV
jgi:hypothetical protein